MAPKPERIRSESPSDSQSVSASASSYDASPGYESTSSYSPSNQSDSTSGETSSPSGSDSTVTDESEPDLADSPSPSPSFIVNQKKHTVVGVIIKCEHHDKFAVRPTVIHTNDFTDWLPMTSIGESESWEEMGISLLNHILQGKLFSKPEIFDIMHVQVHDSGLWQMRVIFSTVLLKKNPQTDLEEDEEDMEILSQMLDFPDKKFASCVCNQKSLNESMGLTWAPMDTLGIVLENPDIWSLVTEEREWTSPVMFPTLKPLVYEAYAPSHNLTLSRQEELFTTSIMCKRHRPRNYRIIQDDVTFSCLGNILMKQNVQIPPNPRIPPVKVSATPYYDEDAMKMLVMLRRMGDRTVFSPRQPGMNRHIWHNDSKNLKHTIITMKNVLKKAGSIMEKEKRVVEVSSPVRVFGDLHGNFADLMNYDRMFMSFSPYMNKTNFLFLGDYVDRGLNSCEVTLFLMALKILMPNKIFLLRGNHEVKSLQANFTFRSECTTKFSLLRMGPRMWEAFNQAFDRMPFAAVIDQKIFCCHGGIPVSEDYIHRLNQMKRVMRNPEEEGRPAWEILWNDPLSNSDIKNLIRMGIFNQTTEKEASERGFVANTKRGTGFVYSEQRVEDFFSKNQLTHQIRAHEIQLLGYCTHFNGRVTTIFSSSHYNGYANDAAHMFVDATDSRMRICTHNMWKIDRI